jgi:hypothetical protein
MERFWRTLKWASGQYYTTWIIADIARLYDTKWIYRALWMMPVAARAACIN